MKGSLTVRQRDVVRLIGRDRMSYKGVARKLGISQHTARVYAVRIRDKIGSDLAPRDALTAYYWNHLAEESPV